MTYLSKLNLEKQDKAVERNPFERAKSKLLDNMHKQLKAAEAMINGQTFLVERLAFVTGEDGIKSKQLVKRPLKKWYWRDVNGLVRFALRVRNKRLELTAGKTDIVVGDDKDLPVAIKLAMEAVKAGELDKQINKLIGKN